MGYFPRCPLVVFCLVFGLSMDYEVFLVARVAEAARQGADPESRCGPGGRSYGRRHHERGNDHGDGVRRVRVQRFPLIKILGFTLAVAIVLDATIVRMAVGPALLASCRAMELVARSRAGSAEPAHPPAGRTR